MKFLAGIGVSLTTVEALRPANHNAVHLRDEGLIRPPDPGIQKALAEGRTVLTFDLDFRATFWRSHGAKRRVSSSFACETKPHPPSIRAYLASSKPVRQTWRPVLST